MDTLESLIDNYAKGLLADAKEDKCPNGTDPSAWRHRLKATIIHKMITELKPSSHKRLDDLIYKKIKSTCDSVNNIHNKE
jgi:hypothetical protein